ncbi:S1 RNA-binding domain-containing protein [Streptomyces murinus]|uniref:S1 RNA-binding domain-containing protein n=1 Tax=Streptomyces murinus TaxID=33900 RepID=UPI00237932AC|nr:S1 RNA-binding domain-containing protein [Streptomyces murinus]WDO09447.1 S1 RNA-binding domain-containing protein [Streptomyces murinus]
MTEPTMTGPTSDPLECLRERLVAPGESVTGAVAGFDGGDVLVLLDGDAPGLPSGRVPRHELTWRDVQDPSDVLTVGQRIRAEVTMRGGHDGRTLLSARACEDEALYGFLRGLGRGDVVAGTVSSVHRFGVFVRIDGEPGHPVYGGTGFINVPELSWSRFEDPAEVVVPGQRIRVEVLGSDTRRGQAALSLKALQDDPWDELAVAAGDVLAGPVTKVIPFGVFVRVNECVEGLVHSDELGGRSAEEGQELRVRVLEVDRAGRRIRLGLAD